VKLRPAVLAAIRAEAARGYPHEACGALLGPDPGSIVETIPIPNRETEQPRRRFTVSPMDYLVVEGAADARGLKLVGFWHSHPDHPARPSETDRQYAWPGLLTLVIAVERGEPKALTAWAVDGEASPFHELPLLSDVG
jgi:proteasome lid subunit RPN8/RPN11